MKYYIIAGEASGDLHGSNLIREIKMRDAAANVRAWGGDKMELAGATIVKHYRELAFMGFVEVIKNLPTIFRNLTLCKKDIEQFAPDVLILIDYPGFNLRIAEWAHPKGFKVIYYISPQVWAWKESRVKSIKANVDKMLVILPFEKDFYKKWNYEVEYVGHPLAQVIESFRQSNHESNLKLTAADNTPIVAILPGSRKQEIIKKLPAMLEVSKLFPGYAFIVAKAPGLDESFYNELLAPYSNVSAVVNLTYLLLSKASAAMVTSGTATLETALFGVPEVVCYKAGSMSYQIAKKLIRIKYISLVNLIMDKEVVKELIQDELTVKNLARELNLILNDGTKKAQLTADYATLKNKLMQGGDASANAAIIIQQCLAAWYSSSIN